MNIKYVIKTNKIQDLDWLSKSANNMFVNRNSITIFGNYKLVKELGHLHLQNAELWLINCGLHMNSYTLVRVANVVVLHDKLLTQ